MSEMDKKIMLHYGTSINNGETKLKINLLVVFLVLNKISFSIAYYLKGTTW